MNVRLVLLGFLVILASGTHASARLGETLDQLTARYGPGANAGAPTADFPVAVKMFHKQNWTVTVSLIDGISVGEKFQKSGGVDDVSVQTLLDLNSEGQTWKLTQSGPSLMASLLPGPNAIGKRWDREDGAVATLQAGMRIFLNIESKKLVDAEAAFAAVQKKAHEASLNGF
jgi:hypothetical protein